jgi:acetate---CoA ligase (ADP-forming)
MPHPLDSFFAPESIALIGASRDQEKIPGRLLSMLRKNEYPGKIYPINPNYPDIDGLKCYKTIAEVGAPIDLAVVIIPARAVVGALEECAAVGVKNAVIISSGFAEEGGDSAAMQDKIVEIAGRTGMRISGPNAEGFMSEVQKVAATFSPTVDVKPGHVPLVATKNGSPWSRNPAVSALPSSIAPRHSGLRSAIASAPAMRAISAPASFSNTWCRMPPPT